MPTDDIAGLLSSLSDPRPKSRLKAVKVLHKSAEPQVAQPLAELLRTEADGKVRAAIIKALVSLGGEPVPMALAGALRSGGLDKGSRQSCVLALEDYPDSAAALEALLAALDDESSPVRNAAAVALARFADPRAAEAVSAAIGSGTIKAKAEGIGSLDVARSLDIFPTGKPPYEFFESRIGPADRIQVALRIDRLSNKDYLEGGLVALEDRILVALRHQKRQSVVLRPFGFGEYRYEDIASCSGGPNWESLVFSSGSETVALVNLRFAARLTWKPHLRWIGERIEAERRRRQSADT